jgi:parvulin-like peptidyl-prolyl isomerase
MNRCLLPLGVTLLAAWVAVPSARAALPGSALFADEVVARGKGFEIRRSQLDDAVVAFRANAAARRQLLVEPRAQIEARVLDKLIIIAALNQRAVEADRVKATNSADRIIADLQSGAGGRAAYERQLRVAGVTPEKFRADVIERAISENVMDRELRTRIEVTPERVRQYFDENRKRFEVPETLRVAHILLAAVDPATRRELPADQKLAKRELADKVAARARAGEDFAALVREFSDDPVTKETGGELRLVRGQAAPEFEGAAASLAVGQISDVVVTAYGFHILKLLERTPPRTPDFAEVEERIREALVNAEMDRLMPSYLDKVKQEAEVQVLLETR